MKRTSTGLLPGQGFGKAARKAHPTAMGGIDKVPLPNKPSKPAMMAAALRAPPSMEDMTMSVIRGKARSGAGNKRNGR